MMNKKADVGVDNLMSIIKILVGAAILTLVVIAIITLGKKNADETACKLSVDTRQTLNVKAGGVTTIGTPLACSTKDKKLSGSDEQIKKELADLVAKCWWEFGQGKYDDALKIGTAGFQKECMVCYTISFKDDFKISGDEFLKYLADTTYIYEEAKDSNVPGTADKKITYLDYIQKSEDGTGNIFPTSTIESPQVYAITFGSPTQEPGTWAATGGLIGGIAGGAAVLALTTNPAGWLVITGITVFGGTGIVIGAQAPKLIDFISEREISTIYVTPFEDIQRGGVCAVHT